jgi:hypothetical protein
MTLPPHRIGDKGQRYVLQYFGWPEEDQWNDCIYSDTPFVAARLLDIKCNLPPSCTAVRVLDREAEGEG